MDNFNYKKKFGQNFIKDRSIVERIVNESDILDDTLVIEVGPGKGILTDELSKKARMVISYEIDNDLSVFLNNKFNSIDNVKIIFDDFLTRDIKKDIDKYNYKYLYFIANVPYYITTPILMKVIESQLNVDKIVIMVQKEVGERFSAHIGSRDYSSITVFLNYFFVIEKLFIVDRSKFVPSPNVDSIVIAFTKRDMTSLVNDYKFFFKLVRDSFKFKRKTIKNNLRDYDLEKISSVLINNGLSLSSRAEEIDVDVFVEMSNILS